MTRKKSQLTSKKRTRTQERKDEVLKSVTEYRERKRQRDSSTDSSSSHGSMRSSSRGSVHEEASQRPSTSQHRGNITEEQPRPGPSSRRDQSPVPGPSRRRTDTSPKPGPSRRRPDLLSPPPPPPPQEQESTGESSLESQVSDSDNKSTQKKNRGRPRKRPRPVQLSIRIPAPVQTAEIDNLTAEMDVLSPAKYMEVDPFLPRQPVQPEQMDEDPLVIPPVAVRDAAIVEPPMDVEPIVEVEQVIPALPLPSAFRYNPESDYTRYSNIANMTVVCEFCDALRWRSELPTICCSGGKVRLADIAEPPEPLNSLIRGEHLNSNAFLRSVRSYNSAFQMTSFGGTEIGTDDPRMYTYKIQGQVYHRIGSVLPPYEGMAPRYLQVYFMGDEQLQADLRAGNERLDRNLILDLQRLLHETNPYIRDFKAAIETHPDLNDYRLVIHADKRPSREHRGRHNVPVTDEVAILMVGEERGPRDVVLTLRDSTLRRVMETHRSYDALQYPLIFCRGEDGYNFSVRQMNPDMGVVDNNRKVTAKQFYCFRLMIRQNSPNVIHQFRNLANQFWVDMYAKIETERLRYIRENQPRLRADDYIHLRDEINQGADPADLGQLVILPSNFTAGPRYMHERTQDAFCYVRQHGRPDLFLTITCNPYWPEISARLMNGQFFKHRQDIVTRVFNLKLKKLMDSITNSEVFGKVLCYMYTIEWQKRGLPHAHLLVWLKNRIAPEQIDNVVSAEIPDEQVDPELFEVVRTQMIHGPCGQINPNATCMIDGKCSKKYPRRLLTETFVTESNYPLYRRRAPDAGGFTAQTRVRDEIFAVDNRWIVPYSPFLLKTFKSHINVEIVHNVSAIKYICKYINKGSDQACVAIENERDEIQTYQSGRYISTSEAVWRILGLSVHKRHPPVIHLSVHLENGQRVYYRADNADNVQQQIENPRHSTLMAFFTLCQTDDFARTLFYHEVPAYYTINPRTHIFERRIRGVPVEGHPGVNRCHILGRVYTINPRNSECFYLRLLLHRIRGPTGFAQIRTVDDIVHPTYQAACRALGLLVDDTQWEDTLSDACISERPSKLRHLFAVILEFCQPSDPLKLWDQFKDQLSEDGTRRVLRDHPHLIGNLDKTDIYNEALIKIQRILYHIGGKSLPEYGLPEPHLSAERFTSGDAFETEFMHDPVELMNFVEENLPRLNPEQLTVYNEIVENVRDNRQTLCFLDAPGGTGKTFLTNLIISFLRGQRKVVIAVASSGIAATLLPGGKTAHSTFKIPLDLDSREMPLCAIKRNDKTAKMIRDSALIVWDECTMTNYKAIDAIDRTFRDVMNVDQPMGGKSFLFSGDFRQTLPIVVQGSRADQVLATIRNSAVWPMVRQLTLTINMRVLLGDVDDVHRQFASDLIRIGEGTMEQQDEHIELGASLCRAVGSIDELINSVYPNIRENNQTDDFFKDRSILCPTNDFALMNNLKILREIPAEETVYFSINTVESDDLAVQYPVELLDSIAIPGLPAHEIHLKVGAPIILLRNLNAPKLCNGTRLRVRTLHRNVIEAVVLTGCAAGESVFIPRIPMKPSNYPIDFKRLQFPISLCYAMTINKSQGQTLKIAGVDLRSPIFSHGQLYVAFSRVSDPRNLYVHSPNGRARNIVYQECIRN